MPGQNDRTSKSQRRFRVTYKNGFTYDIWADSPEEARKIAAKGLYAKGEPTSTERIDRPGISR